MSPSSLLCTSYLLQGTIEAPTQTQLVECPVVSTSEPYKKGPQKKKNPSTSQHQKMTPYPGKKPWDYSSLGFGTAIHQTRNMRSNVKGSAEFFPSEGDAMVSGNDLRFQTDEVWKTGTLTGIQINYGRILKRTHLYKGSLKIMQSEARITSDGGNTTIVPIDMYDPMTIQFDYTMGRAIKVLGAMAYAGINVHHTGYSMDFSGWQRPESYKPPSDVKILGKNYSRYKSTPLLHSRQVGIGIDAGALLIAYRYSDTTWLGLEWNGTAGVSFRDAYLNNSISLVFESR